MSDAAARRKAPPTLNRFAPATLISTWFGCGFSPQAPGTAGSVAALVIAVALHALFGWNRWYFGALAILLMPAAVWAAGVTARTTGIKDPQFVVVDEVVGQWMTLAGAVKLNWITFLAALALFRLFDIFKPAPVRQLEALPGGWGINLDDLMAGVYAALVLWVAARFNLY